MLARRLLPGYCKITTENLNGTEELARFSETIMSWYGGYVAVQDYNADGLMDACITYLTTA